MNLAKKTVGIILVAVTLLGVLLYFALTTILYDRFEKLERKEVWNSLDRAENDIKNEVSHLITKTKDWAAWDDTYAFMETRSKAYIASNLTYESVNQLKIDAILFFTPTGSLYHASAVDRTKEVLVPVWEEVREFFETYPEFVRHDSLESVKGGLVRIRDKIALVSSLPVITSEYKGPIRGTVAFLRYLDDEFIAEIAERTKLELSLALVEQHSPPMQNTVVRESSERIVGAKTLNDAFGVPLIKAEVDLERSVMEEGRALIESVLIILALSGVVLCIVVVLLLQKGVISGMLRLQGELKKIAQSADHEGRVTVEGRDELTEIAKCINKTLESLQDAKHVAENASKAKSEFVANMSHELRTPLNGVCAAADLLAISSLNEDQSKLLSIIDSSARSLLLLISDVLDISKINAGKMELSPIVFNLSEFIKELIAAHELVAAARHIVIIANIEENLPKYISMDRVRLGQILNNLISNSLKFTPIHGAVLFDVAITNRNGNAMNITFSVNDSGIGVTKDKQQAIFEAFEQADGSITREFGGTGLGLAISSRLVEMMGGHLELRSIPNYGTRFYFTVPVVETEEAPPPKVEEEKIQHDEKPLRCLLVEDNKTNQYLMSRILGKRDYSITIANDGLEALEIWEKESFDVILMDCQMPKLDGYSTTMKIREIEKGSSKHIPIIALTACAMSEDKEKCLAAGMDDYISKPIDQKKLFDTIHNTVNKRGE